MNFDNYINHLFPKPVQVEKRIGKVGTKKQTGTIKVICANDGLIFESMGDAARYYSINVGNVSKVVRGDRNHYKGLIFKTA